MVKALTFLVIPGRALKAREPGIQKPVLRPVAGFRIAAARRPE